MSSQSSGAAGDMRTGVRLLQQAASRGHVNAVFQLAMMYSHGTGVGKDGAKAGELFVRAADAGHTWAAVYSGHTYTAGLNGAPKAPAMAVKYYRIAADAGNFEAITKLGFGYDVGRGVAVDLSKAVALYQRAADGGNVEAVGHLARMYGEGRGVEKDEVKALKLYQRALDGGAETAACNLENMYVDGR